VQQMNAEIKQACLAEDWDTAIQLAGDAADLAETVLRDVVNLARTVGRRSDARVAQVRGVSASAVTHRFGPRRDLLREAMTTAWEASRQEWDAEQNDT
jgi:hypothetical protein